MDGGTGPTSFRGVRVEGRLHRVLKRGKGKDTRKPDFRYICFQGQVNKKVEDIIVCRYLLPLESRPEKSSFFGIAWREGGSDRGNTINCCRLDWYHIAEANQGEKDVGWIWTRISADVNPCPVYSATRSIHRPTQSRLMSLRRFKPSRSNPGPRTTIFPCQSPRW